MSWLSLLTAIGVGSIVAALIARGVAIAQLRQAWINALRDDLAEVFATSDRVSIFYRDGGDAVALSEQSHRSMAAYRKVLMRLNVTEPLHADLQVKLEALNRVGDRDEYIAKINEGVTSAQRVLKTEWEVTKFGAFARLLKRKYFRLPSLTPGVDA